MLAPEPLSDNARGNFFNNLYREMHHEFDVLKFQLLCKDNLAPIFNPRYGMYEIRTSCEVIIPGNSSVIYNSGVKVIKANNYNISVWLHWNHLTYQAWCDSGNIALPLLDNLLLLKVSNHTDTTVIVPKNTGIGAIKASRVVDVSSTWLMPM